MNTTKSVGWAYPTSPNAAQFNRSKTGGWVVETSTDNNPPTAIAMYDTREQAMHRAGGMAFPWSSSFKLCNPADCDEPLRQLVAKLATDDGAAAILENGAWVAIVQPKHRQNHTIRIFTAAPRLEQLAHIVSKEIECYCTHEGVASKGGFPCAKCLADAALGFMATLEEQQAK